MQSKEIETKYRAGDIKLQDFIKCIEALNPGRKLEVSSHDFYFDKADNDFIMRYRSGARPELTFKRKLKDANNFVRVEVNVPLAADVKLQTVTEFCKEIGYTHNFTIFKTCVIYFWDTYNVVYYIVYDENMLEKDRFIEIEMKEDHVWESEQAAWTELQRIEKALLPIGINAARRIRRSLFEMFRKVPSGKETPPVASE